MSDFVTDSTLAYLTYLGASMNDMRLRKKFIDTILVCGEKRFPAHRFVLCSRSPVFQTLLMQDSKHSESSTVDLEDVEPDVLETLLEYMYLGQTGAFDDISSENFGRILTAAELLNINGCVMYFTNTLLKRKPEKAIEILWDWAFEFNNEDVVQLVIAYIAENITLLSNQKEFRTLSRTRLLSILSHTKLAERDPQDDVMKAILNWIHEDPTNREDCFSNFVSFVAIHKLSEQYVQKLLKEEPLVQQLTEFQKTIVEYFRGNVTSPEIKHKTKDKEKQDEKITTHVIT